MITVVIPTLNRPLSLLRTLRAIAAQTQRPDEVIVVTGTSDSDRVAETARQAGQTVTIIESTPSVCVQRNLGIRHARSEWIWLCDDDIEAPANYLAQVSQHLTTSAWSGAVSGRVEEQTIDGTWHSEYSLRHGRSVVLHWLFQLSVWGTLPPPEHLGPLGRLARRRLLAAGNGLSHAGWPVNIDFSTGVVRVAVYGLGAAVIRRNWLLASAFDESLDSHGIGDNYGVALGFPCASPPEPMLYGPAEALRASLPIEILTSLSVRHHKSSAGRLDAAPAHELRVRALVRFVSQQVRFRWHHRAALIWSLFGLALLALARGRAREAAHNLRLTLHACSRLARPRG